MTSAALDNAFIEKALRDAVVSARLATPPSAGLPWEASLDEGILHLMVTTRRGPRGVAPGKRQALIRCGAALLNARVILARHGLIASVTRFPTGPAAATFARIDVALPREPEEPMADERLAPLAAWIRSTARECWSEADAGLPRGTVAKLAASAAQEDAVLVRVVRADHLAGLERLHRRAEHVLGPDLEPWPMAFTGANRNGPGIGTLPAQRTLSGNSTLLLLGTRDNAAPAWLRAGEAQQRVSLELARSGMTARPMTLLSAVPSEWSAVRRTLSLDFHPQVLLRVVEAEADRSDA